MPESAWTKVNPQENRSYEQNRQQGRPPKKGFQSWGSESTVSYHQNGIVSGLRDRAQRKKA